MSDAQSIVERLQAERGWNDSDALALLCEYLDNQQSADALEDFLRNQCDDDADLSGTGIGRSLYQPFEEFNPRRLPDKLAALATCVTHRARDDALGHLMDLLYYLKPNFQVEISDPRDQLGWRMHREAEFGSSLYYTLLHQAYGQRIVPIEESHGD